MNGYGGVVAEHITCASKLDLALSVVLGRQLFSNIVTGRHVANRIMFWVNHLKLPGEFNFLPIDTLMAKRDVTLTKQQEEFAMPLLSLVKFPEEMRRAFEV